MSSYPENEITVNSSIDGSAEPSLFFRAEGEEKRPLLVGLHTWSYNRENQVNNMLPVARENNFHLLLPEFRGSNTKNNPRCKDACGSPVAVRDILDAIEYVKGICPVDEYNIFLLGASGGGHMSLMTAAAAPTLFKAVGAFVPITDLKKWTQQNKNYAPHVSACCGSETEMLRRSPISYIDELSKVNLKIFHGKFDNCVPFTQSVELYLEILKKHPDARVFLDVFDGGHEMSMKTAMDWLLSQYVKFKKTDVTG